MPLSPNVKKAMKIFKDAADGGTGIPNRKGPVWKGPEEDGITQSLLNRFIMCRERFRVLVVEGLKSHDRFNHRLEYGSMWHVCEEALARGIDPLHQEPVFPGSTDKTWGELQAYARGLCEKYPTDQEQVDHWYRVCKVQFPIYVQYWAKHADNLNRTPVFQELAFKVPYTLPSGRVVTLRGKFDAVDLIKEGKKPLLWLQENKTKGEIDEQKIQNQLRFDLQTMFYLVALENLDISYSELLNNPIGGVRYNVIRRPLSGGVGSIRQHKPSKSNPQGETKDQFYARVAAVIHEAPETYFMRWKVGITPDDIEQFKRRFLNPMLEQLCDWWEWINYFPKDPFHPDPGDGNDDEKMRLGLAYGVHWQTPYGMYNILAEGGATEVDEYLATGSKVGLTRTDNLFPELT